MRHAGTAPHSRCGGRMIPRVRAWLDETHGAGFELASVDDTEGFGLSSMRARTRSLGGVFWVESQPAQGTSVEVVLP